MSSLAWIDFDEAERQRAQRIMALFQEREARDELGLGAIRDSIADHLFPGTSTIHTRLRYVLFIPWIFKSLENRNVSEGQLRTEARAQEIGLSDALLTGGEKNGVIGSDAGPRLQRLPSSVYWACLGSWGIRVFPGSVDSLFVSLRDARRRRPVMDGEDAAASLPSLPFWSPTLPPAPSNLRQTAVFQLTSDEAQFIIDRLLATQPSALITWLAREGISAQCDHIWTHPRLASFPAEARRLVRHGELFSLAMHGASLLYNLSLSELRGRDDWVSDYRERMRLWSEDLDLDALRHWPLDEFWKAVQHPGHSIRPGLKRFVTRWLEIAAEFPKQIAGSPEARRLVEDRERGLKVTQSRYTNRAVRDRWTGASGVGRLNFRWNQASSHLKDLADAH